jgi:hypothetical protein
MIESQRWDAGSVLVVHVVPSGDVMYEADE